MVQKKNLKIIGFFLFIGSIYFLTDSHHNTDSQNDLTKDYRLKLSETKVQTSTKNLSEEKTCDSSSAGTTCNSSEIKDVVEQVPSKLEVESEDTDNYFIIDPETETDLSLEEIRKRVKLSPEEEENLEKYVDKLNYNEEGKQAIRKIWLDMKASKIVSRGVIYEEVMDGPMPGDPTYDTEEP